MFCEKCGAKIEDGVKFCEECGTAVVSEEIVIETPEKEVPKNEFVAPVLDENADETPVLNSVPQVPREKKPMSKKNKIILIASLVLVICLVCLYYVGKTLADPARIVNSYVDAVSSGDYAKAYEYMDIEESEFTTKEIYEKVMQNQKTKEDSDILNYTIEEVGNESGLMRVYGVTYTKKGGTSTSYMDVTLMKQPGKKWLFFDDYKIAEDGLVAKEYTITAPDGATVYVDDIKVEETYIREDEESQAGIKSYVIPSLFEGQHKIKVESPYAKEKIYDEEVYSGNVLTIYRLELTDEAKTGIYTVAESFVSDFITSAIDKKPFETLEKYFSSSADIEDLKERFESLTERGINEDGVGVKSVTMETFESSSGDEYGVSSHYTVRVNYEYNYTLLEEDWYDETIEEYTTDDPEDSSATVNLVYENGNWLVSSFYTSIYF